jgi:hypothetical protein
MSRLLVREERGGGGRALSRRLSRRTTALRVGPLDNPVWSTHTVT